jgi:hypothetical protein
MATVARLHLAHQAITRQDAAPQRKDGVDPAPGLLPGEVLDGRAAWAERDVALVSAELQRRAINATLDGEFLVALRLLARARGLLHGRLQAEALA